MFQSDIKRMIRDSLMEEIEELLQPLDSIMNIGGAYLQNFVTLFDSFKAIKDAVVTLKNGYGTILISISSV